MLNVQTFNDTDGHHIEIDRREVVSAYIERREGHSTIQITWGEGRACSLGIGARGEIEGWLGRKLEMLSPVAAAYTKPVATTARDLAWLDASLARMRDEAIVRVGPSAAAREIAALAMVVLHPPIDPVLADHQQRAFQLLRQAHEALVAVAGDGNGVRTTADYHRAMMDEIAAMKARGGEVDAATNGAEPKPQ
jgi:hypothetical protein